jgi:hypothetical protein
LLREEREREREKFKYLVEPDTIINLIQIELQFILWHILSVIFQTETEFSRALNLVEVVMRLSSILNHSF